MAHIHLRKKHGVKSSDDIRLTVQDRTYDFLMSSITPEVRISGYFDRNYEKVDPYFEEVHLSDDCQYEALVTSISPGSRTRKNIVLPGPMQIGEQFTIIVKRRPKKTFE